MREKNEERLLSSAVAHSWLPSTSATQPDIQPAEYPSNIGNATSQRFSDLEPYVNNIQKLSVLISQLNQKTNGIDVYIPQCHEHKPLVHQLMYVSFCAIGSVGECSSVAKKKFLHEIAHKKACGLSWLTWSWFLERYYCSVYKMYCFGVLSTSSRVASSSLIFGRMQQYFQNLTAHTKTI